MERIVTVSGAKQNCLSLDCIPFFAARLPIEHGVVLEVRSSITSSIDLGDTIEEICVEDVLPTSADVKSLENE